MFCFDVEEIQTDDKLKEKQKINNKLSRILDHNKLQEQLQYTLDTVYISPELFWKNTILLKDIPSDGVFINNLVLICSDPSL